MRSAPARKECSQPVETLTQARLAKAERLARVNEMPFIDVSRDGGFFAGTFKSIQEIWQHRELLGRLVRREVKARYKDSKLGIVWSLFRPIIQLLIYYFAIGKIMGAGRSVPDYAVFVFVGLTFWMLYSEIISGGVRSIMDNAGLVKKVYLPREIFPLSAIGSALVNFGIQLGVLLIGIALISRYAWSPQLLLAPLAFLTILIFGGALALLVAALNVYLRDIQHFVEIYLLIFFWASPIVYPFTFVHRELNGNWLEQIYLANPATIAIIGAQKALWSSGSTGAGSIVQYWPPNLDVRLIIVLAVSVVVLWLAQRVFARLQGNFAQEL
jgi:ABC-2 type transport system permease protein